MNFQKKLLFLRIHVFFLLFYNIFIVHLLKYLLKINLIKVLENDTLVSDLVSKLYTLDTTKYNNLSCIGNLLFLKWNVVFYKLIENLKENKSKALEYEIVETVIYSTKKICFFKNPVQVN